MKKILITIFVLISVSLVLATDYPSTPHAFFGTIKDSDGNLIPDGYIVTGKLNGIITGRSIVKNGQYGYEDSMIVQSYGESGTISFYVNGKKTEQTFEFSSMAVTNLDLTVDYPPSNFDSVCGDGVCNLNECSYCLLDCNIARTDVCIGNNNCDFGIGETCSNAPEDCGECSDNNNPSGGSNNNQGGGGGGSSGSGSSTPVQATPPNSTHSSPTPINVSNPEQDSTLGFLNVDTSQSSGITGAITGVFRTTGTIVAVGFVLIILVGFVVVMIKKKS